MFILRGQASILNTDISGVVRCGWLWHNEVINVAHENYVFMGV